MDRLDKIHDDLQGIKQTATNQLNDLIDIRKGLKKIRKFVELKNEDSLTEMKEHIAREERIEEERDLMIDNTHNIILVIKEKITRLGRE